MRLTTAVLAAVMVCPPLVGHAQSGGRLDAIRSSGEISLGYRESSIPFAYLDQDGAPVGYAMDICNGIVQAVGAATGRTLAVRKVPVTPTTRVPLLINGTIDLECGSTTNNVDRQRQVDFAPTTFVAGTRILTKKAAHVFSLQALKGKTIVSTAGTTSMKWLSEYNESSGAGLTILSAKDHAEAFTMVERGEAVAFLMDDVLLAGLVASSARPDDWVMSTEAYTTEPYGIMQPKDDPAFRKVVNDAVTAMIHDGTIEKLYVKWFNSPVPPRQINLNLPMSDALKQALTQPGISGNGSVSH